VTNAGSNGKFLGVLDLDVVAGSSPIFAIGWVGRWFSALLPPDPGMGEHIA
jgi:hypothetical protein